MRSMGQEGTLKMTRELLNLDRNHSKQVKESKIIIKKCKHHKVGSVPRKNNPALRSAGGSPKKGVPHTPLPPTPTWEKWIFCLAPGKPLFPRILFLQHDSCISHWTQFLRASSLAPGDPARGKQSSWGGTRGAHSLPGNRDFCFSFLRLL